MTDPNGKISWPMLGVLLSVFVYAVFASMQLGSLQQQVISTSKEISEAKLATASLAAEAVLQQQTLAEANTLLRERASRLEVQDGSKK